jgi:hypothetical protein
LRRVPLINASTVFGESEAFVTVDSSFDGRRVPDRATAHDLRVEHTRNVAVAIDDEHAAVAADRAEPRR